MEANLLVKEDGPDIMKATRILIVDDHPFFRKGLLTMLSTTDKYSVVGEANDGEEALKRVSELQPDVVIMDITMPGIDGISAATQIKAESPDSRILMLSMHEDPLYAIKSFRSGASAYLIKGSASGELLYALERITAGKYFISPIMANELLSDMIEIIKTNVPVDPTDTLTRREREILTLIAEGWANIKISEELFISLSTVKTHRANIMKKLDVHDVTSLVKLAMSKGIV